MSQAAIFIERGDKMKEKPFGIFIRQNTYTAAQICGVLYGNAGDAGKI